jgi:protein-tyrosine phosphatase
MSTQLTAKRTSFGAFVDKRYGTIRGWVRLMLSYPQNYLLHLPSAGLDLRLVKRLVFVCQGNICRSAFADGYARTLGLRTASFGLAASSGMPANSRALAKAAQRGVDLSPHRTTNFEEFEFESGDLVLPMEYRQLAKLRAKCSQKNVQLALLGSWASPPRPHVHDPFELSDEYFDTCIDVLTDAVDSLARDLKQAAASTVFIHPKFSEERRRFRWN